MSLKNLLSSNNRYSRTLTWKCDYVYKWRMHWCCIFNESFDCSAFFKFAASMDYHSYHLNYFQCKQQLCVRKWALGTVAMDYVNKSRPLCLHMFHFIDMLGIRTTATISEPKKCPGDNWQDFFGLLLGMRLFSGPLCFIPF